MSVNFFLQAFNFNCYEFARRHLDIVEQFSILPIESATKSVSEERRNQVAFFHIKSEANLTKKMKEMTAKCRKERNQKHKLV